MPDVKQTKMDPGYIASPNTYGQRNDTNLEAAYPESPRWAGAKADEEIVKNFNTVLTNTASEGLGVNNFDPNYSDAPNISEITEVVDDLGLIIPVGGGAGAPTNPYVPPLASPGAGNFTATSQGPSSQVANQPGQEFGSGKDAFEQDPSSTSAAIAAYKIGDTLTKGKRPANDPSE